MPKEKSMNLISMTVGSSGLDLVELYLNKQIPISRRVWRKHTNLIQGYEAGSISDTTERRG